MGIWDPRVPWGKGRRSREGVAEHQQRGCGHGGTVSNLERDLDPLSGVRVDRDHTEVTPTFKEEGRGQTPGN